LALIPGVDAVAAPAMVIVGAAAAGLEWYAAYHHEDGASYLQAGVDTLTFALSGVTLVAKAAAAAPALADGADAADSGRSLWMTGAQRAFSLPVIRSNYIDEVHPDDAPIGLRGFGQELFTNVREPFTVPSGDDASSPAAVTVARVGWAADRLNNVVGTAQDIGAHKTEIDGFQTDIDAVQTDIGALKSDSGVP